MNEEKKIDKLAKKSEQGIKTAPDKTKETHKHKKKTHAVAAAVATEQQQQRT